MASNELYFKPVTELADMLERKEISSVELTKTIIDRTNAVEPKVGAFLSQNEEYTLSQAEASDKRRAEGKSLGALDGIPVGIKDVISDEGQPLTAASQILKDYVSPYTAGSLERLKAHGAVMWGRLNLDEFAMGSSNENSSFKKVHNPWDLERIPGGSSGGSAACVAAGQVPLSLGTDTGGSIRQPAAHCGIVGLKPTYGRVSRYGLAAFASSLDQIGPMGRSVEDVAIALQGIAGPDERDSTCCPKEAPDFRKTMLACSEKKYRLGVPSEYFANGLNPEVREAIEKAIRFYEQQGYEIKEVSLPTLEYGIPVYYILSTAEASSNLARYDGIRYTTRSKRSETAIDVHVRSREEGFGPEVKRRIMLGTYVLSSGHSDAFYKRAQRARTLIRQDFARVYQEVDALITPASPTTAFKLGEKSSDPVQMYLSDVYTISANLAGIPGISIPCGFDSNGLPIGLQLMGKDYQECELMGIAHAFERAHAFKNQHPTL